MKEFDWISRFFIGAGGTSFSVIIQEYSLIVSLVAAVLTVFYMYQQIMYMHWKKRHSVSEWAHSKKVRELEREKMEQENQE